MHKETRATSIPQSVKDIVFKRDGQRCILCGGAGLPHCHVIRRSAGGLGVEQNIVTLCDRCHYAFDEGLDIKNVAPFGFQSRREIKEYIYTYMKDQYPGWSPDGVTYHKWRGIDAE